MTIDALGMESQFVAHLAPVWLALPESVRGRFLVEPTLVEYALSRGIDAEPVSRPPFVPAYPKPRTDGPPCLVASYGDIKGGRRLGYGPFVFLEHGAGQSYGGDPRAPQARNASYAGGKDRDDVGLFLVPNEGCASVWREHYPNARIELVGCPRIDILPRRQLSPMESGPVVAVSFHWDGKFVSPEAGTALGTFAAVLPDLAKRFSVIGHCHPKGDWPDRMARVFRRAGIEFVRDFDEVCRRADVYVCDNSSTIPEFASTGRPVVLLNDRGYRKNVHHGGRFWTWANIGIQVDDPALLGDAILDALDEHPAQQKHREDALNLVYQPRTNGAAYAVTAITDWLTSRAEVAA